MTNKATYEELELKILELENSLDFYKNVVDYTYNWEVFRDHTGKLLYSSASMERITGYNNDDYLSGVITMKDFIYPDDYERTFLKFRRALNFETIDAFEFRIIKQGGELIYIEASAQPVLKNNRYIGFRTSLHDVTKRKKQEEIINEAHDRYQEQVVEYKKLAEVLSKTNVKLNDSEAKFSTAFKKAPYAKIISRIDNGEIIEVNEMLCEYLGYSEAELVGISTYDIHVWNDLADRKYVTRQITQGRRVSDYEIGYLRRDGSLRYGLFSAEEVTVNNQKLMLSSLVDITDRKGIEKELKDREWKFRSIFENSHDAIGILKNGLIFFCNQAYLSEFGFESEAELVGHSILDQISRKERARIKEIIENRNKDKDAPLHYETIGLRKNGVEFPFEITVGSFFQHGEKYSIGIIRNIAARKTAEQLQKQSEEKFRMVFNMLPDLLCIADLNNATFKLINPAATRILGYQEHELLSNSFFEFIHPDDIKTTNEVIENELSLGKTVHNFKNRYRCKDGSYRWLDWSAYPVPESGVMYALAQDITMKIEDEERIRKQNEQLQMLSYELETIIDNIPGLVFYKDTHNRFLRVNQFMSSAYNLPQKNMEGLNLFDFYTKKQAQAYFDDDLEVIRSKQAKLNIDEIWEVGSEIRWVSTSKIPNFDAKGEVIGIIGISMDVTERRKSEDIIKEQNVQLTKLNADKDRFIQILAHDLRSPFNALLGFSSLLSRNVNKYAIEKIEKLAHFIHETSERTFNLLEDTLLWARAQSGQLQFEPQEFELTRFCSSIIDDMRVIAQNKDIAIYHHSVAEIEIFGDKNMLSVVLRNLISNAIKFTNNCGSIAVVAEKKYSEIMISVADTGVGIEADIQNTLFDLTSKVSTEGTNKEIGTGLGLVLCKEFVAKHGGVIWIESEVGKGSVFSFTIPARIV